MLHKLPNHRCDLPVIGMSSSEGKKAEKFWDYCFLFTIIIFVLLGLSFAASFPAAGLGRSLKLKNGRKKWHLWYMITSLLSVISQMPLVLYFWGPVTDGLIEGKTKAYKWILAGPRQYPVTDLTVLRSLRMAITQILLFPLWLAVIHFHTTRTWNAFKGFT